METNISILSLVMREAFILTIIAVLVSCTTTLETSKKLEDSRTITEQRQSVQKEKIEDSVEDIKEKSQLLRKIEEEKNRRELIIKKKDDLRRIDESYDMESKKPYKDRNWDTALASSEYYLKKYSNPQEIDEDYVYVESIVIACLTNKGEYNLLIKFVDSSYTMTQTQKLDPDFSVR